MAHGRLCTRIVGRIDTQQLPSPGSDSRACESAVTILAITGHDVYKSRLENLLSGVREPLDVRVLGRPGVGCRTVIRALRSLGIRATAAAGELDVYVFSETLKPEDLAALSRSPQLVIFNKADLIGFGAAPIDAARGRCSELTQQFRLPFEPLASLAAIAGTDANVLDESAWTALEKLVAQPADLGSVDGFLSCPHGVPRDIRGKLLTDLDLYGIGCAVAMLRSGGDRQSVRAALRQASGVDGVLAALERASAPLRYQRLAAALKRADADWAACDEVVLAKMDAAARVLAGVGMAPEPVDDAAGYLRRAIAWDRNSRGFLSPLYRACSADIVRGSLRLLAECGRR